MKTRTSYLSVLLTIGLLASTLPPLPAATLTADEAFEVGLEAYLYFYPLITMDVTRRVMTNVPPGAKQGLGPMNLFTHFKTFPPAEFKDVVRPNFDTLYSVAWLDLTKEPMIVSVPDTGGRYYLLPMLDMWTDVFAVPGKRTSGTAAKNFAVVPPGWKGRVPDTFEVIYAPTPYVWIIGRTQTNGTKDYEAVHKVQDGYRTIPLSQWGTTPTAVAFKADPTVDMKTPPLDQVNGMQPKAYFTYGAELMKLHPPHVTDWSMVQRLKRIGIEQGKTFDWDKADPAIQQGLTRAATAALKAMYAQLPKMARVVDGWQMNTDTMGVYGNFYLKRAIIAMAGLGANQPEDAVYPLNTTDADGRVHQGGSRYLMHFAKDQLPPAAAFWSVTLYDEAGFQVANPINRFAIGDRDSLKFNPDGSLDLYIQNTSPGSDHESNWLPAPAKGPISLVMRLYAPRIQVLGGRWTPPALQCMDDRADALPK